jgi:hypothetical protein
MKPLTRRQREVLSHVRSKRPLCYGGGGYWFFHAEAFRINARTGFSLSHRKYLVARRKRKSWLTEYDLSEKGKRALRSKAS